MRAIWQSKRWAAGLTEASYRGWRAGAAAMVSLAFWLFVANAQGQQPASAVSGAGGVKLDAVEKIRRADPGVNKVNGIDTINGVKADGQAPPPPPPVSVTSAAVSSAGSIQAVQGVAGLNATKLENLETALAIKEGAHPPTGPGEHTGRGKAAAAALLSAPLDKAPPKTGPKEDGRAGFQEFEKLQNRGS